jgi:hypothetical protein
MVHNYFFDTVHHKNNKHKIKSAGRSMTQKQMQETNLIFATVFLQVVLPRTIRYHTHTEQCSMQNPTTSWCVNHQCSEKWLVLYQKTKMHSYTKQWANWLHLEPTNNVACIHMKL